jgi:thymidine kinase
MTVVPASEFYEYTVNEDTAECEGCDKVMELPDTDAIDTGMEEPFWYHEEVHTYIGGNYDKYHAYCKSCYDEKLEEMQE